MVLAQPRWRSICSPSAATASMSGAGGRIATALAVVLAGVASPELIAGGRALGGAIAAPVAEAAASRAGSAALQKRCRLQLRSKLAKVPVFVVTNDGGSPFLSQIPGGDQSALLFLFPAEAQKMLQGVLKAPNGASSGAKITLSNLERAYQLASKPPSFSGLRDQVTNRELTMVWQFAPHAAEVRAAQALMVRSMKAPVAPKLPAYMVNGLAYDKRGKEVRPVFLSQKDAAAAMEQTAAAADGAGVKQEARGAAERGSRGRSLAGGERASSPDLPRSPQISPAERGHPPRGAVQVVVIVLVIAHETVVSDDSGSRG
mmetsp:Transcript_4509/g.14619  ORF Transcript_4509/g.14619 Transcript_4509/m.14619 type:complete len:316 (-) Transcript_4509:116-1063(-)